MPTPPGPITRNDVNKAIKDHFDEKWQEMYDRLDRHRACKSMMPKIDRNNLKYLLKLGKNSINELAQHITGRGHYRGWYYTLYEDAVPDITCQLCNEPGTVEEPSHLWYKCTGTISRPSGEGGNPPVPTLKTVLQYFKNNRVRQFILDPNKTWLDQYLNERENLAVAPAID